MNNDLKYYRVFFDERVYVKKGPCATQRPPFIFFMIRFLTWFSPPHRGNVFLWLDWKLLYFFSESGILWILTKRIIQIRGIGKKNKYRGIGEVQAPDKCSAQQNTTVKRLWMGFYSIPSQELAKLKFSNSQLGIYFFILIINIFSDCWLEIDRKLNVR